MFPPSSWSWRWIKVKVPNPPARQNASVAAPVLGRTCAGDSIEGKKVLITGRKIMPSGRPVKDRLSGAFRHEVSVKINGAGEVKKPFEPPVPVYSTASATALGARISGENLWGYSCQPVRRDDFSVGGAGRTHTHSGQAWMMERFCYLEVVRDFLKRTAVRAHEVRPCIEAAPTTVIVH